MEDEAQDQRPGPDPLRHEAWDSSQTAAPGGGLRCDGMCATLLFTLRVSLSLFVPTQLMNQIDKKTCIITEIKLFNL